jgi:hypothetical protein
MAENGDDSCPVCGHPERNHPDHTHAECADWVREEHREMP